MDAPHEVREMLYREVVDRIRAMRRAAVQAFGALLADIAFASCESRTSTLLPCPRAIAVSAERLGGPFPPGDYSLILDVGGYSDTCAVTLPLDPHTTTCVDTHGSLQPSVLTWGAEDPEIRFVLKLADSVLVDSIMTLRYEESWPNGRECGVCRYAVAMV